ncbi:PQQ-binding-like beta-propeller repeat protein [Cellulomonas sp. Y8]|uniref:outer membrane protein assembly factor BamB family protein n=1 Tax=Cellulomonas sp. Y8 TaxID=2591145 RepID=UPI0011CB0705|nr:PQQ-binding-like beta-propeller repeat protein [Cellulomonas sp. Y8]
MGADRMAEVQLDDVTEPQPGPVAPSLTAARARALLRRWWPAPVAVVLALVAAQVVADRRDEAAADRFRSTPGVLAETVTAPLEATPWGTGDAMGLLMSGTRTADGLIAGVLTPGSGEPAAVVALDPGTGEEQWRAEIGVLVTEDGYTRSASCTSGADAPAATLWCAVTDGPAGDGGPVTTRLVEVDLAARAVAGARELEPGAEATVVGDVLVVGVRRGDGLVLTGSDVGGTERWRTEIDDPVDPSFWSGWLASAGGHVIVQGTAATWAVDPADGRIEADAGALYAARGDALVAVPTTGALRLLGPDGSATATLDGYPLYLSPDDGSAPGIQPVSAPDGSGGVVRGVEAATGRTLWERPAETGPRSGYLLLDGVLYGTDLGAVWAVDALTGAERWSVTAPPVDGTGLMTDGRHLLRAEREDGTADLVLSAYDLGSGRRAWTTPLPDGVEFLWSWDGALYGYGSDGREMVLLR